MAVQKSLIVLKDANLQLRRGEMVAIVAPSGAGKSTLLHLLAALDTPNERYYILRFENIETQNEAALADFRNRSIGFLWQRHQLLPDFTAAENVAMPLLLRGESISSGLEKGRKWLDKVGLAERADHRTGELFRRRTAASRDSRALVTGPRLLLADEPTGDLDEQNAWAVFDLLERLHRTHGLTSLIATHNLKLRTMRSILGIGTRMFWKFAKRRRLRAGALECWTDKRQRGRNELTCSNAIQKKRGASSFSRAMKRASMEALH